MYRNGLTEHSRIEDEYFYKKDRELIEKIKENERKKHDLMERTLHYRKCGKCGHDMDERARDQITLLFCNHCESVHLSLKTMEGLATGGQLKAVLNDLYNQLKTLKESA